MSLQALMGLWWLVTQTHVLVGSEERTSYLATQQPCISVIRCNDEMRVWGLRPQKGTGEETRYSIGGKDKAGCPCVQERSSIHVVIPVFWKGVRCRVYLGRQVFLVSTCDQSAV